MDYERNITLVAPFDEVVTRTRVALAEQGFGVLTEIDVREVLRNRLGLDLEPYLILGACYPDLAHQALDVDRALGVLLPCNVVVRADRGNVVVHIFEPRVMSVLTGHRALEPLAEEASRRLTAVLDRVSAGPAQAP